MIELLILAAAFVFDPADCGNVEIDFDEPYAGCERVAPDPDPEPDPDPPPSGGPCAPVVIPEYRVERHVCPTYTRQTSVIIAEGFGGLRHMGGGNLFGESTCIPQDPFIQDIIDRDGGTFTIRGNDMRFQMVPGNPLPLNVVFAGNRQEWVGPIGNFTVTGSNVVVNGVCYQ